MSLLPQYTAPPAVNWNVAYWADDPQNRGNPNNPFIGVDVMWPTNDNRQRTQSALWSTFKTWVTNKYGITLA